MAWAAAWGVAWAVVAVCAMVMVTQAFGWDGVTMLVPIAQVFTPHLGVASALVAAVALWRQRFTLATLATVTGMSVLLLGAPAVFPGTQPEPVPDAVGLRVAAVNLLYRNTRIDAVAAELATLDADVLALSEYTADHRAGLMAAGLAETYPYRLELPHSGPIGIAVWSRFPISDDVPPDTYTESIDATIHGPDGPIRLVAVHLESPVSNAALWRREHALVEELIATIDGPTLIAGDFNSSYWHPPFRRLLDAGVTDAHIALGAGLSASWPAHVVVPPFVRLDHALVGGGLVATDVDDVDAAGSDHRGVIVTVAPTG